MMQRLRDPCPELQEPASQEQFGYELLASSHMLRRESGGGFRFRLGCRWLALPLASLPKATFRCKNFSKTAL
jgi:hypothetical protein